MSEVKTVEVEVDVSRVGCCFVESSLEVEANIPSRSQSFVTPVSISRGLSLLAEDFDRLALQLDGVGWKSSTYKALRRGPVVGEA